MLDRIGYVLFWVGVLSALGFLAAAAIGGGRLPARTLLALAGCSLLGGVALRFLFRQR